MRSIMYFTVKVVTYPILRINLDPALCYDKLCLTVQESLLDTVSTARGSGWVRLMLQWINISLAN